MTEDDLSKDKNASLAVMFGYAFILRSYLGTLGSTHPYGTGMPMMY